MYPIFNIFGKEIPAWGSMVGLGVLCLVGILFYQFNKYNINNKKIDKLILFVACCGMMFYLSAVFFDALWHNIDVWQKTGVFEWNWYGITFSGGMIGAIITYFVGYFIFFRDEKHNLFFYIDFIIPGVVLTHAFGRVGCFLGGCCYGGHTDSWLGINYPTSYGWDTVFPTQLFEAGFLFILFIVLLFFVKRNQLCIYLLTYGPFRFLLEYLRGDSRGGTIFGIFTPSQFMSVIMIIAGILLIIFTNKITYALKKKYHPELLNPNN